MQDSALLLRGVLLTAKREIKEAASCFFANLFCAGASAEQRVQLKMLTLKSALTWRSISPTVLAATARKIVLKTE